MRIVALLGQDAFRLTIGWALENIGHDVCFVDQIDACLLDDALISFRPDILFDMGWDSCHCPPGKLDVLAQWLQSRRLYHIYFAEEDWLHHERWSSTYMTTVNPDYVLSRSLRTLPSYERLGIPASFLDVGCNPNFHRPVPINQQYVCDVSVVANVQFDWDIFRRQSIAQLVLPLLHSTVDLRLFGRDWNHIPEYFGDLVSSDRIRGTLPYHLTPVVYSATKINLGIQSVPDQCSNRTYDILCNGGFLLTSDTPAVRERFTQGVHCDMSGSPQETLEKVKYYLAHDDIRRSIAARGMEYVRSRFAYQVTLPQVWPDIEAHYASHGRRRLP